jgi:hypothetical protein
MQCPKCKSKLLNKAGKTQRGTPQFRCAFCGCRFVEKRFIEEKVEFGDRMPWPPEYFTDPPLSKSPLADMGI